MYALLSLSVAAFDFTQYVAFSDTSAWWTRIAYIFGSRNLFTAIINSILAIYVFHACSRLNVKHYGLVILLAAVGSTLGTESTIATAGASGLIFAALGCIMVYSHTRRNVVSMLVVFGVNIALAAIGETNVRLHIVAFGIAYALCILITCVERLKITYNEKQNKQIRRK